MAGVARVGESGGKGALRVRTDLEKLAHLTAGAGVSPVLRWSSPERWREVEGEADGRGPARQCLRVGRGQHAPSARERPRAVLAVSKRAVCATPAWAEPVGRLRSAVVGRSARSPRGRSLPGRLGPCPSGPPAQQCCFSFSFLIKIA